MAETAEPASAEKRERRSVVEIVAANAFPGCEELPPLHVAAFRNDVSGCKELLQRHKHNINAEDDKHGTTAAYVCCQQGNHECLAVLAVATGVDLGAFL